MEEGETGKETRSSDGDKCYKTMQDNVVGNEGGAPGKWVEPTLEVLSRKTDAQNTGRSQQAESWWFQAENAASTEAQKELRCGGGRSEKQE